MKKSLLLVLVIAFGLAGCVIKDDVGEKMVKLYYYNAQKDVGENGNVLCSREGLQPVERFIEESNAVIEDTIRLLLKGGISKAEEDAGLKSEFPLEGLKLVQSELVNGVLTLTFEDPNNRTSGGACRAGILWFQIEETAKQFEDVEEVKFEPETLFQP